MLGPQTPLKYLSQSILAEMNRIKILVLENYSFSNIESVLIKYTFIDDILIEIGLTDHTEYDFENWLKTNANKSALFYRPNTFDGFERVKNNLFNCEKNLVEKFSYPKYISGYSTKRNEGNY